MALHQDLHRIDGALIVRFSEHHIDAANCDAVFSVLMQTVESEHPELLILNFRYVSYLHSVAIGNVIQLRNLVQSYGGEMRLCNLDPQIIETLSIIRVDRLFNIWDTEKAALPATSLHRLST